jgi:NAD+ diphosphatase
MIQNIEPKKFHNEFTQKAVNNNSIILAYKNDKILCKVLNEALTYPAFSEIDCKGEHLIYAFSIDETEYYLHNSQEELVLSGFSYENIKIFRESKPKDIVYAGFVGFQLYKWYRDTKFCGRCGNLLKADAKERMMSCPECGNTIYPAIAPVIIVGVTNGDKLLMTKYAGRDYTNYALVAGFTEIGETIEQTVEREVMEEVGLKVKNITFYKSQPWAYSNSLLFGFFAEVDGGTDITLEEAELSEGQWFLKDEIDLTKDDVSLTREMILKFKNS